MRVTNETRALAHEILAYWLRFNHHEQSSWVESRDPDIEVAKIGKREVNICNTSMCAAGTAVFLNTTPAKFKKFAEDNYDNDGFWEAKAGKLLGLTFEEANSVFYSDNKSAVRFMKAIAAGSQKKFDKALERREHV